MEKSFEQPHLDPNSELYKSGFRIPETGVSVEVLEAEEMPKIEVDDVFTLDEQGFYLPKEAMPSQETQEKRKGYLQKLLELPFVEKVREKSKEVSQVVDNVLSKTLEYYLAVVPFLSYKGRVEEFLDEKLENFDPNEMKELMDKKPLLNVKLVSRYLKRKDFLGAYEAFWGTWNPQPHKAARSVYDALGGNERPVTATAGSFLYSGVALHAFHPYMFPIYTIQAASGSPERIASTAAFVTGTYIALGIPVIIRKGIESFKKKIKDNIPEFAAKPERSSEQA